MIEVTAEALAAHPFLHGMSRDHLAVLAEAASDVTFPAKERLFDQVFAGEDDVQPDAIEVVAYRLRKKLAVTDVKLVTLRGLGYLVAPQ